MTMLDLLENGLQFAGQSFVDSETEDLRDLVWNEPQQAHVAGTFEELVNGIVSAKDQVATVLDLLNRAVTQELSLDEAVAVQLPNSGVTHGRRDFPGPAPAPAPGF